MPTVTANGQEFEFEPGTTNDQIGAALDEYFAGSIKAQQQTAANTSVIAGDIDKERGAPMNVRVAVASAKKPEDKLATLKKFYPDARVMDDNFVFTDPDTGRQTAFNPEGFDIGDLGDYTRMGFELLGGGIGAGVGALGGPAAEVTVPALGAVGATAGGAFYDWMAGGLYPVEDSRTITESMTDLGAETGLNFVGGEVGKAAGKMVTNLGAKVSKAVKKPISEVFGAGERVGAELPVGTLTGSKTLQSAEEALSKMPITSDIIGNKYSKSLESMKNFAESTAGKLSGERGETAVGMQIKKGIEGQVSKFKKQAGDLYDQLWGKLPKGERVSLDSTKSTLDDIAGQFKDDPEFEKILGSKTMERLSKAVDAAQDQGGATVGTLKALRTKIGHSLDDSALISDTANSELSRLYGSLSDDLQKAAYNAGAEAKYAFDRASNFYKGGREIIDNTFQPIVKNEIPEQMYRSIFGQEGGALKRYPASQINKLFKSLDSETKKTVSSEFVRRMGAARSGAQNIEGDVFSPNVFMTNWNKMPKEVKETIFDKGTRNALDDLATLSQAMKDKATVANVSNTAPTLYMMQLLTAPLAGYGAGEATGIGGGKMAFAAMTPYAAAKLMTSKPFIKWITKTVSDGVTEQVVGENLGRLYAIAEANPAIKNELYQYANALKSASEQPVIDEPENRAVNE